MASADIASVHFLDGVCIDRDWLYLATQLDALDPDETAHTRMSVLDLTQPHPWAYHDYEDNIVSVHAYRCAKECLPDGSRYAALGRHGTVRFNERNTPSFTETLPGAGLLGSNTGGLMTHLREIDGALWACGQGGQVFRRFGRDDWRHVDTGLHVPLNLKDFEGKPDELAEAMFNSPMLNCIDGFNGADVYVVGLRGFMAHFDGQCWQKIDLPTDEHLLWVRCDGQDVWACGTNGALLKGDIRRGFKDLSTLQDKQTWVCLTRYRDQTWLSAEEGLYVFDGQAIAPVRTGLEPELQDAWRVDHVDGVLWSIGINDLARFDGQHWERIQHPDNEPILDYQSSRSVSPRSNRLGLQPESPHLALLARTPSVMTSLPNRDAPHIVRFADIADRLPHESWIIRRDKANAGEFADERVLWVPASCHLPVLNMAEWPLPEGETDPLFMVVVDGDLSLGTVYNWDTDGCTGLMVLGNLTLDHAVVGGQEIFVCGDLDVRQLYWGDYNHGGLQVLGRIRARFLLTSDGYHLPTDNRDGDEIEYLFDEEEIEQERDWGDIAAQYFVETVLNRRERDPSGLTGVLPRYRVVEALLRGETALRTRFELLQPIEVPRRWGEVALSDRSSMMAQEALFQALIEIVPADEPEQPFRSQHFAADVFVTRAHRRESDGNEVPDLLLILGDDGLEVRIWKESPRMLGRLVGRSEGLNAMFKHMEKDIFSFRPIWDQPEVIERVQGIWNEALRRAEAWYFWMPQLPSRVNASDILALLELPIVKDHYNDWDDPDRCGFWDGYLDYAFHRPSDDEPWAILRINIERQDTDEFDTRGYFFEVSDLETPGPVMLRYRSSQEKNPMGSPADRYCHNSRRLSVFDAGQIEEALRWYERCMKRLPYCVPEELHEDDEED